MSKMMALGIILSAKDMASSVLGKTSKNILKLQKDSEKFKKKFGSIAKTMDQLKHKLQEVDRARKLLGNRQLRLKQDLDAGKISAEQFAQKMRRLNQIESILNSRRLRLTNELKKARNEAGRVDRKMKDLQRRIKIINGLGKASRIATWGGTAALGVGAATKGWSEAPIRAFTELEDAQTQLKIALMNKNGNVSKNFAEINKQALELGNKLPGTTADFYKIATVLKSLGVSEKSITGGVLKSSAYLAVVLKGMGVSYEEAAMSAAKFKQALGVDDKNMLKFMDDIQRMSYMGVSLTEMRYGFSKMGAVLQGLGIKGLKAAKDIEPFVGMLIRAGYSGETVGTNLGAAIKRAVLLRGSKLEKKIRKKFHIRFHFTDHKGKFIGMHKMLEQLERKMRHLNATQKQQLISMLFGTGEAGSMFSKILAEGTEGIRKFEEEMRRQADIRQRTEAGLRTLSAKWEAFTGTMENVLAIIGEQVSPILKKITDRLGEFADWLTKLKDTSPGLVKWASIAVVGFSSAATALGVLGLGIGLVLNGLKTIAAPISGTVGLIRRLIGPANAAKGATCALGGCAGEAAGKMGKLNSKVRTARGLFSSPLTLTVALVGATAVIAGLNKIAKSSHQAIMDKRSIAPRAANIKALEEKYKRLKERLAAAKGEDGFLTRLGESFLHGSNDNAKIKQLEKLVERTKHNLDIARQAGKKIAAPAAVVTAAVASPLPPSPYKPAPVVQRVAANMGRAPKQVQHNENHTYNISVTIHGSTITKSDVEAAISRVMRDAAYHSKQRTMSDL
ncbi:phage tail tape measure protein [Nitratifractor salsuginis]|uniref:Phage tail tape measure protein, TP901 family n=1 Tax=Nitratifractor salsuginis (strain DSM 16511 / JCM 12458 / E9I37-1) TaxID=749222 RepID=E6X1M5_NITSE|nr:phage tail tape measure protein [Nitratifractor salsuginis]ADV47016.1 phage tail tape measure protein, TP901 family [Nitratifractor salsuginis DSM 16511]